MGDLTQSFDTAEAVAKAAPVSGITAGSAVLTMDGALPVQYLAPGDRVITRSGMRVLKEVEVTVAQNVTMVRIAASALGHDRPEADLFVAPAQAIYVRDWRAKALYNKAAVMVEAQRLCDGDYIRKEVVAEVRLFTLRFEREEVVYASGLELACTPVTVAA